MRTLLTAEACVRGRLARSGRTDNLAISSARWRRTARLNAAALVRRAASLCSSPVAGARTPDDDVADALAALADALDARREAAIAPPDPESLAEAA